MATEQDFLLRTDSTDGQPQAEIHPRRNTEPHDQPNWEQVKKLQCRLGALLLLVLAFCAFLYTQQLEERGSRNFVIPGGHDPAVGTGGRRISKYDATQFISFSINTMGGLDAHGEESFAL